MGAGSIPPRHAVVVKFYVETSKCDWTHAYAHRMSQTAAEGPSRFSFCKMQLLKQHVKKSLKYEASLTDIEMSGWLVNSLELLFFGVQTVLFGVTGTDRWWGCFNTWYPNSQHGEKEGNISQGNAVLAFIGWIPPMQWEVDLWKSTSMEDVCGRVGHEHVQAFSEI